MTYSKSLPLACLALGMALAGCTPGTMPEFLKPQASAQPPAQEPGQTDSVMLVERDVEAPEVFQVTDTGLWDGRPSLGGVWVAHPDVGDPERVIIRNSSNGKFVIGALFRRERDLPGPALQVSSDAATTLGMLAGQPQPLNVTALRRQQTPDTENTAAPTQALAPMGVTTESLASTAPSPLPAATATSSLTKPLVQIGIFSVQSNAQATVRRLTQAGLPATIIPGESSGKKFWRVVVGPAQSSAQRATYLAKAKAQGFADAYIVTN